GERAGGDTGPRLAPQADPANWWGTRAATLSDVPVRPPDRPVTLSASALTSVLTCPAQWFLEREAGGAAASTAAQGFGLVVHTLAERIARGELSDDPSQIDALMEQVDQVWGQLTFRTPWTASRERDEVRAALERFVHWHGREDARTLVAVEQEIRCEVELPDGSRVALYGFADRLEIDDDGRVVVVDLKTGKYPPTREEVAAHPQLGLYQYAVAQGAVDDVVTDHVDVPARPGGAELVHLRKESRGRVSVQTQGPPERDEDGRLLIEDQLMEAAALIRAEEFPARSGKHCDNCGFQSICPIKGAGTVLT
ncbi:PD-(D/E)XK nuclease family protein, partial [Nocardioides sp.]|uniref:RecB family exonuclease n=1 Tax=Nocardioides sp. TaxID=35761 RepID=UPI002733D37E